MKCIGTYIEENVDISLGAREDHRVLAARFRATGSVSRPKVLGDKLNHDKSRSDDPSCVHHFHWLVVQFRSRSQMGIDEHAVQLNEHIGKAAIRAFGKATDRPVKPWITASTWRVVKWVAPFRRATHRAYRSLNKCELQMCFLTWASCISVDYTIGSAVPHFGCGATTKMHDVYMRVSFLCAANAACWHTCQLLQKVAKPLLAHDRHQFLLSMAEDAQRATYHGKTRQCFTIVLQFAGKAAMPHARSMKTLNDELTQCETEKQQRWQEHFASVF